MGVELAALEERRDELTDVLTEGELGGERLEVDPRGGEAGDRLQEQVGGETALCHQRPALGREDGVRDRVGRVVEAAVLLLQETLQPQRVRRLELGGRDLRCRAQTATPDSSLVLTSAASSTSTLT